MCEICNGYPNCPVCGEEVEMIKCKKCNGTGECKSEVDGYEYMCYHCDGTGEIEAPKYEPDPDEKHDNRY